MPVEVMAGAMADIPVTLLGIPSEDMPPQVMLEADTLVSVLAVEAATMLRGPRAATRVMQAAHIIGTAVVAGEAVTGIRPMDIHWAITAWATAIQTTEVAITVTDTVVTIHTTGIGDTTLTYTDIGRP